MSNTERGMSIMEAVLKIQGVILGEVRQGRLYLGTEEAITILLDDIVDECRAIQDYPENREDD